MPTATAVPAAAPAAAKKAPKQLPAPNSDFYELYETLNAEELATVKRVRAFMEAAAVVQAVDPARAKAQLRRSESKGTRGVAA